MCFTVDEPRKKPQQGDQSVGDKNTLQADAGGGENQVDGLAVAWDEDLADRDLAPDQGLVIDVEGFAGPLDLLLAMARTQKVDLAKISVLDLVEQYLAFIAELQKLRLEVAADYLVMAAWLTFLKSRLLLPREEDDEESETAEMMAARLAFRLKRLDAMRDAAAKLMTRPRLGRQVFPRGRPEGIRTIRETQYTAKIYDLLKAYSDQRQRNVTVKHVVKRRRVWSIKEARQRLERLLGQQAIDWVQLELILKRFVITNEEERTAAASSFVASLEMAREGVLEIHQEKPFGPIYLRPFSRQQTRGLDEGK